MHNAMTVYKINTFQYLTKYILYISTTDKMMYNVCQKMRLA